jgi:hypothetical protein
MSDNLSPHLVWTARSMAKQYGSFFLQEWSAPSAATISGKTATATFSGTISGNTALAVFGVSYSGLAFDSNLGLPSGYLTSVTSGTSVETVASNNLAPDLFVSSLLLVPQAVVTPAAGWSAVAAVNATSFELEIQAKRVASLQIDLSAGGSFASGDYTATLMVDAIRESDATDNPYTEKMVGQLISSDGLVSKFFQPVVSVSGTTITYDFSDGAMSTRTESHTSRKNPLTNPEDNENDT